MNVLALFRRPATSASDIRAKLAELNDAMPSLAAEARAAAQKRAAGLLNASDADLEKLEAAMLRAGRDHDRAVAAVAELERLANDAEAAEAKAILDAEIAAADKAAKAVAARLVREYGDHAAALIKILTDLEAAENAVALVNRRLAEAGRGDEALPLVETRAIGAGSCLETVASIRSLTSLRPVGASPGWGEGRRVAETFGLPV